MSINNITLTFFPKEIECVKDCFISALGKEYIVHRIAKYEGTLMNYYIQQYNAPQVQFILFEPKNAPHTTIMFANVMDGYVNLNKLVSKQRGMEYCDVKISNGDSQMMEAYHFHYYSPLKDRYVLCYQDPQWVFYEEGTPLPFEDTELYKSRIKRNRLNKEVILRYLKCVGWNVEDECFWLSNNAIYEFEKTSNKRL